MRGRRSGAALIPVAARMVERNPWWKNVAGPFPTWTGPVGVKEDGGGCHYGQGTVGKMVVWRAVNNRDKDAIVRAVDEGHSVNEVEGAGNTPLHAAAYQGWCEGVELLLSLGAAMNASNNAGDRPWHWARNMDHTNIMDLLVKKGAETEQGDVIVQDHVPKVKDFFDKPCWAHHPKPYAEYMEWRHKEEERLEAQANMLIPGV